MISMTANPYKQTAPKKNFKYYQNSMTPKSSKSQAKMIQNFYDGQMKKPSSLGNVIPTMVENNKMKNQLDKSFGTEWKSTLAPKSSIYNKTARPSAGITSTAAAPSTSLQDMMKKYVTDNFNNPPQYTGPLTTTQSPLEQQLSDLISNRLNGQGLGMSQQEQDTYMEQLQKGLNEQRNDSVGNVLKGMNSRGLLNSTMTTKGLSDVNKNYADSLADSQSNMFLQNEQMKRNAMNNAMGMGLNLSQLAQTRDTGDLNRQLQNWYQQQQLNQTPFQNALQYMQGIQMPLDQYEAKRVSEQSGGFGQFFGTLLGGLTGGPFGGRFGSWLFGNKNN